MAGPDTVETWETTTESHVVVNRYDRRGGEKGAVVGGVVGKRVQVTTAEREELNEERAATVALDPFRNGYLRPVRNVPEDVMTRFNEETKAVGGMTTEELVAALESKKGQPFRVFVGKLNEATLRRLATIAPEADASASQLQAIEEALGRFKVTLNVTEADRLVRADPKTPQTV